MSPVEIKSCLMHCESVCSNSLACHCLFLCKKRLKALKKKKRSANSSFKYFNKLNVEKRY